MFPSLMNTPLVLLVAFTFIVLTIVGMKSTALFVPRYGRRHRVCGALYLIWLLVGVLDLARRYLQNVVHEALVPTHELYSKWYIIYDAVLGVLGILLTVSAAFDFPTHNAVKNPAGVVSGTLSDKATVSFSEMMEHSFYQGLNLWQAFYLHASAFLGSNIVERQWPFVILLLLVTSPWLARPLFPVNSFSSNYDPSQKGDDNPLSLLSVMYRIKKYQYLFYKHFLLHGLNISVALFYINNRNGLEATEQKCTYQQTKLDPTSFYWRSFWICLNTSYVMEFFLQTLVKKRHLKQGLMLHLNKCLMAASSVAALLVIWRHVASNLFVLAACFLSSLLNFLHRGFEVSNTAISFGFALTGSHFFSGLPCSN